MVFLGAKRREQNEQGTFKLVEFVQSMRDLISSIKKELSRFFHFIYYIYLINI